MDKFVTVSIAEAIEKGYILEGEDSSHLDYGEWYNCLYETDGKRPVRLVATDIMEVVTDTVEPEDTVLYRDLSWVVVELNKLAEAATNWRKLLEASPKIKTVSGGTIDPEEVLLDVFRENARLRKKLREAGVE